MSQDDETRPLHCGTAGGWQDVPDSAQPGYRRFYDEVRRVVIATRAGRRLSDEVIHHLTEDVAWAAFRYHAEAEDHAAFGESGSAKLFAEDVAAKLDALRSRISKYRASTAAVSAGEADHLSAKRQFLSSAHEVFLGKAVEWLPQLDAWYLDAKCEALRWAKSPHRRPDQPRLRLAQCVADALSKIGMRLTTGADGAFARLLGEVVFPHVGVRTSASTAAEIVREIVKRTQEHQRDDVGRRHGTVRLGKKGSRIRT